VSKVYLTQFQTRPIISAVHTALDEMLGDALAYAEAHDLDDDAVEREVADATRRWAEAIFERHFPSHKSNGVNQ